MKLYFTADAKINPEHSLLFNKIAVDIRNVFTDNIDSLSRQNKDSIDWWISSPASRNIFASPLFNYCCCLSLLQELINAKKHFTEIITDSRAFKKILENYLSERGVDAKVTLARLPVKQHLKELVRPIYTMFGIPLKQCVLFFIARQTRYLRKSPPSVPLTLIDIFVMPGYIEKDRYYPGLLDALSEKEKDAIWFVPHLYGFRMWQFMSVLIRLRKAETNFLLKDDFLKLGDYWCLWGHLFRIRNLKINPSFFRSVDISPLVSEELTGFRGIGSSYAPLLNFCFVKRLKQAGVNLRLVIDWFENQNFDKGWNGGFRRFFPGVEIRGYQGFVVTKHYLSLYPTKEEKKSEVIPHKILVVGRELVEAAKEFCPALDVKIGPAFRFQHVWLTRKYFPVRNEYTILVALPIVIREAIYILMLLALDSKNSVGMRFLIKPHPATSKDSIKEAYGSRWPEQFEFVGGDFNDCVEKSDLLISNASSACMETLAKGIPVIIIGNSYGLTHNPVPETITDDIWQLCYSQEEINRAIQFYKNRGHDNIKEHEAIGRKIREGYFEPVTRVAVRKFLQLM